MKYNVVLVVCCLGIMVSTGVRAQERDDQDLSGTLRRVHSENTVFQGGSLLGASLSMP